MQTEVMRICEIPHNHPSLSLRFVVLTTLTTFAVLRTIVLVQRHRARVFARLA